MYTFDRDVSTIEVSLAWWSKKEQVSMVNSNYYIDYLLPSGEPCAIVDLWRDVRLSYDTSKPTKVKVSFPKGVRDIRIYGSTVDTIADRNKGRLSIFDMYVEY